MKKTLLVVSVLGFMLLVSRSASASSFTFDGAADNGTGFYGYYYQITGGLFPTGTDPNGDNASGGAFRFIADDPSWGYPIDAWQKDDWFPQNAGLALTIQDSGTTVYDNNGLEDGSYGNYYNAQAQGTADAATPGLYKAYGMPNNFDWMYASYFRLVEDTTFDTLIAYFDANGSVFDVGDNPFDMNDPNIRYIMDIWSTTGDCQADGVGCLPKDTGSFVGDVFSTELTAGTFTTSLTGVNRVFSDGTTDPIARVTFSLARPITLPAGEYAFGSGAVIDPVPEPATLLLVGGGLALAGRLARRRRKG
jgi:PEP-CTERM motif